MGTENRASITKRPATEQLLAEMTAASGLSQSELFNCGIDTLHFIWSVLKQGGEIATKFPGDARHTKMEIFIPGLIRREE